MNETKWTPGPWHAIDRSPEEGLKIRGGGHHYPIAQAKSYWDGPGARREEALANLDLMAAAPDLYEALDNLLSDMRAGVSHTTGCFEAADRAIAKALGEE